jgi:hypothetical protein
VERRGFSWRNGILGSLFFGDNGFLAGFLGSNNHVCECQHCGFEWTIED